MRNCLIKCLLTWLISLERSLTYPSVVVTNSNALRGPKTQKNKQKKKTKQAQGLAGKKEKRGGMEMDGNWRTNPRLKAFPFFPS